MLSWVMDECHGKEAFEGLAVMDFREADALQMDRAGVAGEAVCFTTNRRHCDPSEAPCAAYGWLKAEGPQQKRLA
jgi:hypothetical protein